MHKAQTLGNGLGSDREMLLVRDGYTPRVGILAGIMLLAQEITILRVRDLTTEQLDTFVDANSNTIGMLLSHLIAIEMKYYAKVFEGRELTPREDSFWGAGLRLWDRARHIMHGYPVSFYIDEMARVRARTVARLKGVDDEWLSQRFDPSSEPPVWDNAFALFHVVEDEIAHRGQIIWARRLLGLDERQSFPTDVREEMQAPIQELAVIEGRVVASVGRAPDVVRVRPAEPSRTAPVGLLDFGLLHLGATPAGIVSSTVGAVEAADRLGFSRYWLAEHHSGSCAWGDPIPLIPLLASRTDRIRVGTGGTLVSIYTAASIASDFALLSRLFPNRIDLGFARGVPTINRDQLLDADQATMLPLELYDSRVRDVCRMLRVTPSAPSDQARMMTVPDPKEAPEAWVLGTPGHAAALAIQADAGLVCSLFHTKEPDLVAMARLHERHSLHRGGRGFGVAVAGICARSDRAVGQRFDKRLLPYGAFPTVVGTIDQCRERIASLFENLRPDFVMYLDLTPGDQERLDSIDALASAITELG